MASKHLGDEHPLAEVFGYHPDNFSPEAKSARKNKLCPHNNIDAKCNKDKKSDPLGVCSLRYKEKPTVICPIRFREDWKICEDAADFFFPKDSIWTPVTEVRLKDKYGKAAGNIDVVLIRHTRNRKILDFGAIEVQGVYISGNIRKPFEHYMKNPLKNHSMSWLEEDDYPKPDYLSSSRKRLIPQLLYKGQILNSWGKKQAVVIDRFFYDTLPPMPKTNREDAELCWMVYKMDDHKTFGRYTINLDFKVLTGFEEAMKKIGNPEIGEMSDFVASLGKKLSSTLDSLKIQYNVDSMSELLAKRKLSAQPASLEKPILDNGL